MTSLKRITVLLVDDHMVVREGIRELLQGEGDIEVVAEASSGRQAVSAARKLRPAVVVMDIAMPSLNGLEATRQIGQVAPGTRVLILSAHSDDSYVERAAEVGAAGYLMKQVSANCLADAIRAASAGKSTVRPATARGGDPRGPAVPGRAGGLRAKAARVSPREMEVLQLIAEGGANKQIASELGISIKTVEKHRDHLMQKLDIHDTAGLTRYAIAKGLVECDVKLQIV